MAPQKRSSRKGKCKRRRSTSGNGVTRGSTSLWRGYMLKWTVKTSLLCLRFGALFVGSTRLEIICGHKNFTMAWIDGSSNHKTSNITDHANSESHKAAMMHFRKDQAKSRNEAITSYSPIACSVLLSSMDPTVRE